MIPPYAELHCVTHFSFLRGASHPEELVARAHAQGYSALAITDECSVAGVVRAHQKAKSLGLPLLVGAEFGLHGLFGHPDSPVGAPRRRGTGASEVQDGRTLDTRAAARDARTPAARLVLIAQDREGYGRLCERITRARLRASKAHYRLLPEDLDDGVPGCVALLVPCPAVAVQTAGDDATPGSPLARLHEQARFVRERFGRRAWLAVELLARGHDMPLLARLRAVSRDCGLPLVAAGDVHYHLRSRRALHDVLTATRLGRPVRELGFALPPNAEQHLRTRLRLAQLYPSDLMEQTLEVAAHCTFSLDSLRYEYPQEIVPESHTPASWLRHLTDQGAALRYPDGLPASVRAQIEHELTLIADLHYEPYFLTVADIVRFARERGILCQGRGSAANSAVCYCLGITEVDPARMNVLFERFISRERNEPPDIDVDFEHQRREEVIQYLYRKYGRERTALAAAVTTYRPRSALRDVGRALGVDAQRIDRLARTQQWWDGGTILAERFAEAGFDPDSRIVRQWIALTRELVGFPRHLSQHSGGFVIARDSLARLVPIENAAMPQRSVIQWDKDDLDALGLLKVDVLALGMLTAIRRALALITLRRGGAAGGGTEFRLQDIPAEDPQTYRMISQADTVGVFQIESRAQMSMLPRLQPRCFYDLVIEVAIVRPGPIQGGMVHPYLRRRQGLEPVAYPRPEIRPALERTLGVPIFQEQVMQIAILAAGFTPGEADALRRAMAAWRRKGGLQAFQRKVIDGMLARGYDAEFAERIFRQIEGFGEYGFPESHAASFALLVYTSAWIKRHEPAAFLAALLDSQPMGFYAPAQLVRDARAHGVVVRGPCVFASDWHSRLEELDETPPRVSNGIDARTQPAVRLGLNRIAGLGEAAARQLVAARGRRLEAGIDPPFADLQDLAREARLERRDLQALARADALAALAGHRIEAAWQAVAIAPMPALLQDAPFDEARLALPAMAEGESVLADYASIGLPMGRHPVALLRDALARFHVQPAAALQRFPDGRLARASGLVTHRQRPETARGVVFVTLEDETGTVNVIVWPGVLERWRKEVMGARLMTVYGTWQADAAGRVTHLIAQRVVDHSPLLGSLAARSRDFR
jgi:error-prone DNA polymerase